MNRIWKILAQSEFHTLLFALGLIVLNWPFLGTLREKSPAVVLGTILVLWVIAITLLFLINRGCRRYLRNETGNDGKGRNAS